MGAEESRVMLPDPSKQEDFSKHITDTTPVALFANLGPPFVFFQIGTTIGRAFAVMRNGIKFPSQMHRSASIFYNFI
jgi:hypothetical protein